MICDSRRYAQTNLQLYAELERQGIDYEGLVRVNSAYELATCLFANRFRTCGRPFICHLVGTASIAGHFGANLDTIIAGLLHAAYEHGEFGNGSQRMSSSHRKHMRSVVGDDVESLVMHYTIEAWPPENLELMLERIERNNIDSATRSLVLLRLSNLLDDLTDQAMSYFGPFKKASVLSELPPALNLSTAMNLPELAEQIELAARCDSERQWVKPRNRSYVVAPVRLRERLRRKLSSVFGIGRLTNFWERVRKAR